jgi:hypothetical protein
MRRPLSALLLLLGVVEGGKGGPAAVPPPPSPPRAPTSFTLRGEALSAELRVALLRNGGVRVAAEPGSTSLVLSAVTTAEDLPPGVRWIHLLGDSDTRGLTLELVQVRPPAADSEVQPAAQAACRRSDGAPSSPVLFSDLYPASVSGF